MNNYHVFGTLTLNVSMNLSANNEEEARQKVNMMLSTLNLNVCDFIIETVDGKKHKLNVNDFHIEWENALK